MSIMDSDQLLMAYADGELDEAAAREVEQRIACDPRARAQVDLYRGTASLLRSACGEASYAQAAARPPPPPPRPGLSRGRAALALAASIGLGVLGFGVGRALPGPGNPDFLAEAAEYHTVISRETTHLAETPASRPDEATAWLGARIARKLVVPDLTRTGLRFAGARLLVIDGQPVADLLYTRERGQPVALCIARMSGDARPIRLVRRDGMQLASWQDGSFVYVVVGDLDRRAAREIAGQAVMQLRG